MKKTLIALAIAGLSFNAAAVNLDTKESVPSYAAELKLPQTLALTVDADEVVADDHVVAKTEAAIAFVPADGATPAVSTKFFVKAKLTNAKLAQTLTAAGYKVDGATTSATVVGGGVGDDFVIFEADTTAPIEKGTLAAVKIGRVLATGGDVGVTVSYHTSLQNAQNDTGSLWAAKSGTLLKFAKGIEVAATKGKPAVADVTKEFKRFEDDAVVANLGAATVKAVDNVRKADGSAIALDNIFTDKSVVTLTGDFSAAKKDADGKYILSSVSLGGVPASKIEDGKATFVGNDEFDAAALALTVSGEDVLAEQTLTASFAPVLTNADNYVFAAADLGAVGQITRNGATAEMDLVVSPTSSYKQFVRLSNKSTRDGKVTVTAINDAGVSKTIDLGAVADQESVLKAGASTTQISVADLVSAAGLELSGQNKVRFIFNGEMPSNKLSAQSYVLSTDGTTLVQFN
ncbi:hypothetical protein [Aeromonas caviae]|uniref:hypothetical protein n=1 Tax=Aeromonas caviae TaxID=648 RepID=UPI00244C014C|nr:hypothetical protein [Aeromonas caviae]MDH1450860.1 hypothetical protein [Aeromonas caviae]MDH1454752.1 hypothetical protein [Aeromonas caviae]MDH1497662.1 hypothetical protein [Aeromonas caviae]